MSSLGYNTTLLTRRTVERNRMTPDWQLPPGVDRGLHDYLRSTDMVRGYDAMMAISPLATVDCDFCERWFPAPGRLLDLGCGTGRLGRHFGPMGFEYVGVDLSEEMLAVAENQKATERESFAKANLVELDAEQFRDFDYTACLFSTLGMICGNENRDGVLRNAFRALRPGGRFVLHVHNRYFHGLGFRGWTRGDIAMPQAYGGAPLTLHHYSLGEAMRSVRGVGFRILEVMPVSAGGVLTKRWCLPKLRSYGYLIAAEKQVPAIL